MAVAGPISRRGSGVAAVGLLLVLALGACGGQRRQTRTVTVTSPPVPGRGPSDVVLSLASLGTFRGRCPRGARSWTLRFVGDAQATDRVSYRIGSGHARTLTVDPGATIAFSLVPGVARTREPPDRLASPRGPGGGTARGVSVPTTTPLRVDIYQGSEPQILRADVTLALTTIGGESAQCILVGSTVAARAYPTS